MGKKVVIVLTSGSAVALGPAADGASALLEAWYPGESGGTAVANLLTGKTNPSGRLPVTFYRSVNDLPAFTDYSMANRTYRYFDKPVEYGFGFGLSYTHFVYSNLHLSAATVQAGTLLTATVTVRNAGDRAGAEVSEMYLVPPSAPKSPKLALKGIERVQLNPGESRTLQFTLSPETMSIVDTEGARHVIAGDYRVYVGSTQPGLTRTPSAQFTVTGETMISPPLHPEVATKPAP
jgi:beta-glucosidase